MNQAISRLGSAIGCVLVTIALTPLAKADEWDKKTVITTRRPIEIEGKVLKPGQYVMRLLDSSDRHILQIFDVNQVKVEMTILALPAYRQEPTGDTRLTFSETPTGQVRALRTWFYPGDNSGLEFSIRQNPLITSPAGSKHPRGRSVLFKDLLVVVLATNNVGCRLCA